MKLVKTFSGTERTYTISDFEDKVLSITPGLNRRLADDEAKFLLEMVFKRMGTTPPEIEVSHKRKQSDYNVRSHTIDVPYTNLTALTLSRESARAVGGSSFISKYVEILSYVMRISQGTLTSIVKEMSL